MTDEQQARIVELTLAGELMSCYRFIEIPGKLNEPCGRPFIRWRRRGSAGWKLCPWCAVAVKTSWMTFLSKREIEDLEIAKLECEKQDWLLSLPTSSRPTS